MGLVLNFEILCQWLIRLFIIWSTLIGSFSVGIFQYGQAVYFCFGAKPANSKFETKTAKKCEYFHSFTAELSEKAKKIEEFLETFNWPRNRHHRKEVIDDFINQQQSANTNTKTATDMNTFLRYMEANGMKNDTYLYVRALPPFVKETIPYN